LPAHGRPLPPLALGDLATVGLCPHGGLSLPKVRSHRTPRPNSLLMGHYELIPVFCSIAHAPGRVLLMGFSPSPLVPFPARGWGSGGWAAVRAEPSGTPASPLPDSIPSAQAEDRCRHDRDRDGHG